jgi:hypothetical protein
MGAVLNYSGRILLSLDSFFLFVVKESDPRVRRRRQPTDIDHDSDCLSIHGLEDNILRTVDERLASPFHQLRVLVDRFKSGDLTCDDFLESLDIYDEKLQIVYEGVAADPGMFEVEEDPEVIVESQMGIHAFSDASEKLRTYAENHDEELALEALEMARGAHERWVELVEVRGDLLSLIESMRESEAGMELLDSAEDAW